jgi:hypothetical protein
VVRGHAYGARRIVKITLRGHVGFMTVAGVERRIQLPLAHANLKCMPAQKNVNLVRMQNHEY